MNKLLVLHSSSMNCPELLYIINMFEVSEGPQYGGWKNPSPKVLSENSVSFEVLAVLSQNRCNLPTSCELEDCESKLWYLIYADSAEMMSPFLIALDTSSL